MAIVIDPAAGALASAIGNLGGALGERVFEQKNREKELLKDEARRFALLPSARAAERGGPGVLQAFAEGQGLSPEFVTESILTLAPTSEQLGEETFIAKGGPSLAVETQISESILRGETAEAAVSAGLPALVSARDAQAAITGQKQDELILGGLIIDEELGITRRLAVNRFEQAGLESQAIADFQEFVNKLPEDQFIIAQAALVNPTVGSVLASMRNTDINALARKAAVGALTDVEKTTLTFELEERLNTAIDELRDAEESGADKDFIDQKKQTVENARLLIGNLVQTGSILPIDITGVTGKRGKIDLTVFDFKDPEVASIFDQLEKELAGEVELAEGEAPPTIEELIAVATSTASRLSVRGQEEFKAKFPEVLAQLEPEAAPSPGLDPALGFDPARVRGAALGLIDLLGQFLSAPVGDEGSQRERR